MGHPTETAFDEVTRRRLVTFRMRRLPNEIHRKMLASEASAFSQDRVEKPLLFTSAWICCYIFLLAGIANIFLEST